MHQVTPFYRKFLRFEHFSLQFIVFLVSLIILASISLFILPHKIDGDAVTYVDAIKVLNGAPLNEEIGMHDYVIHRIMTTFLGLQVINGLSFIFGSIEVAWLFWAAILYFFVNIIFYKLLFKMFDNEKVAAIGGLFFAANYAMVIFGLTYFMDIGGWTFYILSIYFLYLYIDSDTPKWLWIAALTMAIGGFFKENALFAYIPLFFVVLYEHRSSLDSFVKKIVPLSLITFVPTIIHQYIVYIVYGENYFHWIKINHTVYVYKSRIIEYIKSFGSLLNFLIPISFFGLFPFIRSIKNRSFDLKRVVFLIGVFISSLPAVMWPGITQRVLFMVVPGLVMLACFFIKKYDRYWYIFAIIIFIYATLSLLMDSFVLNFVNLPF